MQVLIAARDPDLSELWARHLRRSGTVVMTTTAQDVAVDFLTERPVDVVVLDLLLAEGSAIAVADFVAYRRPEARIVFVTPAQFFSDGSGFALNPNTAACLKLETPPEDLAAIVEYHGRTG